MGTLSKVVYILSIYSILLLAGTIIFTGVLKDNNSVNEVIVEIEYFDHWNATISDNHSVQSWSGFGKTEKILRRPSNDPWSLSVDVQKLAGSTGPLSVIIRQVDGTILKKAHTMSPFGKINLTFEIK